MTRKATSKKSTARKATRPGAKAKPAKKPAARAAAPKKPVARSKRQKVFVVQQKVFGVYGDAQYTPPDRVFVTQRAAQQYADERNRELLALGTPFERFDVGSLIKGGDKALVALVEKMGLQPPTKHGPFGRVLDWADWWNAHYFDLTDDQRDALCTALDKFEWFQVRTTTLE
jgi:hypothetical protein